MVSGDDLYVPGIMLIPLADRGAFGTPTFSDLRHVLRRAGGCPDYCQSVLCRYFIFPEADRFRIDFDLTASAHCKVSSSSLRTFFRTSISHFCSAGWQQQAPRGSNIYFSTGTVASSTVLHSCQIYIYIRKQSLGPPTSVHESQPPVVFDLTARFSGLKRLPSKISLDSLVCNHSVASYGLPSDIPLTAFQRVPHVSRNAHSSIAEG